MLGDIKARNRLKQNKIREKREFEETEKKLGLRK
jgi:hypothetical protein